MSGGGESCYMPKKSYRGFKRKPSPRDVRRDLHECRVVGARLGSATRRWKRQQAAAPVFVSSSSP